MSYSGKYRPTNPRKYKGDPRNIVYRSLWERKFMVYCDSHDHIIEWGSEEFQYHIEIQSVAVGEDTFQTSISSMLMGLRTLVVW